MRVWFTVIAGYALLSCVLTWPLPLRLRTHLLGDPAGDLGTYIWNVWIFRHELLRHAHLPVSTRHLFAYTGGADFSLHNYTPIAGLLGVPLVGPLGVVGAFNTLVLAFSTLSGFSMFVLARTLRLRTITAWAAGALFMAAPALVARDTAHLSLMIAAALPLFLWSLLRTLDTRRIQHAALVGAVVAAAYYSDAYYGVYCALMGAFVVTWRYTRINWPDVVPDSVRLKRVLTITIAVFGVLLLWRLWIGSTNLTVGPIRIRLQTLYTPNLILIGATAVRAWLVRRPTLRWCPAADQSKRLLQLGVIATAVCLLLLTPPLVGLAVRGAQGRLPGNKTFWRSSPRGLDALAYVVPNPNHAWFGDVTRTWFMPPQPDAFPEFVGAFSVTAIAIIAFAVWRRVLPRMWLAFTAFFFALSLGPFVHVAGINTYVVGPWAFLRYVPVIGMARSPSRFGIVAVLGMSLLTALSLDRLWRRDRVVCLLNAAMVMALFLEILPAPRRLFSADIPPVYQQVAANGEEQGTLLEFPTGIRDGTSSIGNFSALSEYFQTAHQRPLVGGYFSRVSPWRKREADRSPVLHALFALSEERQPSGDTIAAAKLGRDAFLRRSCVKFVIVNKHKSPRAFRQVAADLLGLTPRYEDDGYTLLTPVDPPECDAPARSASVGGR